MNRTARNLDYQIVKLVERMRREHILLGQYFEEMHKDGGWRDEGFISYEQYIASRTEESKTTIFQLMRIWRELGADGTVSLEDLDTIPVGNAEALARLKKADVKISRRLIDSAKKMSIRDFERVVERRI